MLCRKRSDRTQTYIEKPIAQLIYGRYYRHTFLCCCVTCVYSISSAPVLPPRR